MAVSSREQQLIAPYGGRLVDLIVAEAERAELARRANELPSVVLSERNLCDLELLANGGFSPLDRFMGEADYRRVLDDMRLADGTLFPIPIALPVADPSQISVGHEVALRSRNNEVLAVMLVEELYRRDNEAESLAVCGSTDVAHPLAAEMRFWPEWCIAGPLRVLQTPRYYDFTALRRTPAEVRELLAGYGRANVVAFQTRNPLHRVHEELTKRAIEAVDGALLLHPVVGLTKPGDVDHYTRVRSYRALMERYYDRSRALLSLLPLAMRLAGPREAVWHAIIRRNHGANHFIVGRDHAAPGNDSAGKPFYGPYDAQELVAGVQEEIGVKMVPFQMLVYLPDEARYEEVDQVSDGTRTLSLSGTQVREEYLAKGVALPDWFTRPEVAEILAKAHPPQQERGFCVWFTGLPSAGKSTIAEVLVPMLMEHGRQVTLLDGDVVRTHLSKGLGFSKEDRDTNILRIGFVAAEIVRHQGTVICAAISPYEATRRRVREMVGDEGMVLVHVDTPVSECERRDVKGLYAKARAGELKGFTGVDDPYEAPPTPELRLATVDTTPEENASRIVAYLRERGLLGAV